MLFSGTLSVKWLLWLFGKTMSELALGWAWRLDLSAGALLLPGAMADSLVVGVSWEPEAIGAGLALGCARSLRLLELAWHWGQPRVKICRNTPKSWVHGAGLVVVPACSSDLDSYRSRLLAFPSARPIPIVWSSWHTPVPRQQTIQWIFRTDFL